MKNAAMVGCSLLAISVALTVDAQVNRAPIYANLSEAIALDNDRVLVRRFVIQPGQSTGLHAHTAHQLLIFIKGGVLTSKAGRSTLWPDGRVVWLQDAGRDEGSTRGVNG